MKDEGKKKEQSINLGDKPVTLKKRYQSPVFHLITLAILIFVGEVIVMFIISDKPTFSGVLEHAVKDASLLTVLISPALYFFLFRPFVLHITERKRAEESHMESEKKYRRLVEGMNDSLGVVDKKGIITYVNNRLCEMLGYSQDDMIGSHVTFLFDETNQKIMNEQLAKRKKGEMEKYEIEYTRKDGSKITAINSPQPIIDADGRYMGSFAVITDVTKRKQAEEELKESENQLKSILDNSTAVIYVKDVDGRYTLINRWYETLFKVDRKKIKGKTDHDIFPKEMADTFRANDLKVLEEGSPIEFEEIAPQEDGPHTYISIKFPLLNAKGKIYAVCGISTDITERKLAEEDLRMKSQELETLSEDLRKFSGQLSKEEERSRSRFAKILHEQVGQNLAAIKMKCARILEEHSSDRPKMKKAISHILSILDNTINSTRELTADLYPTILDDLGFIPAVTWYRDLTLNPNNLKILLNIDESVESLPSESKLSLFRIVQEAFQNIAKHSKATEVVVELRRLDSSMRLSIKDNGVGFDLEKVKGKRGKGIGLMLLKERSLSLGGSFKVESVFDKGTKLVVEIPV